MSGNSREVLPHGHWTRSLDRLIIETVLENASLDYGTIIQTSDERWFAGGDTLLISFPRTAPGMNYVSRGRL